MKKVNRFKVIITLAIIILGSLIVAELNPYINAAIIVITFLAYVTAAAWIFDTINEKEQRFIDKMNEVLN